MSNSDYRLPRTNLFDLLPNVYRSGVNESIFETLFNRFLSKTELDHKIGFIGQGSDRSIVDRQVQEADPHRQAFQLQPVIYSQVGTIEHIASSVDIFNELERLGVDIDRMKEWGDAITFNWAPPIDYDKIINFRNYYWENEEDLADQPQYITIQNPCTRAEAKLDEYENTKSEFGSEFNIVGLDANSKEIIIEGDKTLLFTKGFIFYVSGSSNSTINNEFFTTVSSSLVSGVVEKTSIVVEISGSPAFNDSIVDGIVSLEELTQVFQSEVDCSCNGSLGWDGGQWDDNQIGDILWNAALLQGEDVFASDNIQFSTEANWIANNCTGGSPCPEIYDIWHDTTTDTLKQYNGTWIIVQHNFSSIIAATSGGELWDQSENCDTDLNAWQEQNKWVHANQVVNFTLAKRAQIPIIEFLPTVQLNEWVETTYQWKYRAKPAIDDFEETSVQPNLLELIGITNPISPPVAGSPYGYLLQIGSPSYQIAINPRYGDLTSIFIPGFEFKIINDTTTPENNGNYTVDWSIYCKITSLGGEKYQTVIGIVDAFASTASNGTIIPKYTSVGDEFVELYEHWLFAGIDESKPTTRQPINPMLEIEINPPPTAMDYTTSGSPPTVLGTYVKSLYAQELTFTTASFGTISIVDVSIGSPRVWTLTGNHAEIFNDPKFDIIGSVLEINGNTLSGANGRYTIISAVDNGPNTNVTVDEEIPIGAMADGTAFVHWTFTFDATLHDQTRFNVNELRVYIDTERQFGTYTEINEGSATSASPATPPAMTNCDDFVNSILIQVPIEQFNIFRVEVGAIAASDIGYEHIFVRTIENDIIFNPLQNLECTSIVKYRKLEQAKTETNQYPLFDLFDVEGQPVNLASRIFGFQESQDESVDQFVGRRIVHSADRRVYYYEQYLLEEDNGPVYTYRDTSQGIGFWFDTDNHVLYRWDVDNWNPNISTADFVIATGSPPTPVCYLAPIVGEDPPGFPWLSIDGMIWINTNNNTINVSDGTSWNENILLTAGTTFSTTDPTLQSVWRTGLPGNEAYYIPDYVDKDRNPILHNAIIDVTTGINGTWVIYGYLDKKDSSGTEIALLEVGDTITINNNLDINSNKTYLVKNISVNDENRTARITVANIPGTATISGYMTKVGDADGDWEVPDQLYFNNSHENRKILSSTDLLAHLLSVVDNQEVPPGLFGSSADLYHALTVSDLNFGLGGTIKEYNGSYDTFLSSIFVPTVNPISLYEYAYDAYESALNQIKEFYRRDVNTLMTNVSEAAIADISANISNELITQYEKNDFANFVYGDSNTYYQDADVGVRNWPATLPFVHLIDKIEPILFIDPEINLISIRHHDGHLSDIGFIETTLNQFALRIITTEDIRISNLAGKMGMQSNLEPPADFSDYESIFGSTSACYWYHVSSQGRTLYRMSAVRISLESSFPPTSLPIGTYWYDITNDRLKILHEGSPGGPVWINATTSTGKLTEGSVSAWQIININEIFAKVILELETRLYQAVPDFSELAFDVSGTIANRSDLAADYEQDTFYEFITKANISEPFSNSNYDATDPFTWNYKSAAISFAGLSPSPTVNLVVGGTWQDIYQKNYGTPYPHLEPWKLQGYDTKPDWWDDNHKDVTGTRRWNASMWTAYILIGSVPAGEFLSNGSISTGAAGEATTYNYVPVHVSGSNFLDTFGNSYSPDDLFPPLLDPNPDVFRRSIFTSYTLEIQGNDPDADYAYDDAGIVEWAWENSSQYLYDQLKIAFRLQPVRFIQQTLGEVFLNIGSLEVSQALEKIYAHQDARFHGDLIDGTTVLKLPGTLQWYVNFNRFNGFDGSSSNFRPMWTEWTTFLSYQFATFIDTESFILFNRNFDITTHDYEIRIKRSPGIEDHWVEAFNVTLVQSPPVLLRYDTQSNWLFDVSTLNPKGRIVSYYATQSYNFVVDTSVSPVGPLNTMTVSDIYGRSLPWNDGDIVVINSTGFLPSPLLQDTEYYINILGPTSFSLSEEKNGPVIDILSTGSGTLTVSNVARSFTALDGSSTNDKIWYAYELDKNTVLEFSSPTQITGIENVINIIFGYAAYEEDVERFHFNHDTTDIDPSTSRVVNWQLEIERLINWAYNARTEIQRRINFYQWEIDSSPGTLIFASTTEVNAQGDNVTHLKTPKWGTGTKVTAFVGQGGILPEPLLVNTPYYVIRINENTFQLALTAKNARNGNGISLTSSGSGDLYIQELQSRELLPSFEVNPFRNNLWIDTPQGIVSNLLQGPYADIKTDELMFDQYGRRLPSNGILPLRQDLQTRIAIQDGITNDIERDFNNPPNPYKYIHCSAAHIFIDGYENIILFNKYASVGALIYDPFIGLNTPKFDVQFDRSPELTLRPNLGGYVLLNQQNIDFTTSLVRNMEGQTEDLRFAYDTYKSIEGNAFVEEGRNSLGYDGPYDFLSAINVDPKSQFQFWRGLIQTKGSVNSINAYINSRRFIDAQIDEYWAYKLADFGDDSELSLPEINLFADDTRTGEIRFHFVDTPGTADTGFIEVLPNDQLRWYEFPNQDNFFATKGNMYFNVGIDYIDVGPIDYIGTGPHYIELPQPADDVVVVLTSVGSPTPSYTQINSETLEFTGLTGSPLPSLRIYLITPYEDKHNPCKIRDIIEETTVAEVILWDPARNNHYHNAIHLVDQQRDTDAAALPGYEFDIDATTGVIIDQDASTFDPWGAKEKDITWLDTNELGYLPYSDTIIYPNILDRLKQWGRLSDWASYKMFQWTESEVPPDDYDDLAAEQEGDFSIDPQIRVTGQVRKVTYINLGGTGTPNWVEYPFEKIVFGSRRYFVAANVSFTQPNIEDENPLGVESPLEFPHFKAYKDGIEFVGPNADQSSGYYFGNTLLEAAMRFEVDAQSSPTEFTDADRISLVKYFPTLSDIDDIFWKQDTPYNTENKIENGKQVTKYYFWVENKSVPQVWRNKYLSMLEAVDQLEIAPAPYVVPQNLEVSIKGSPTELDRPYRYTQAILRNYGTIINADNRYVLRFTRNFILRDELTDTLDCETTLKTIHQEWEIFRKEQQFNVSRTLWNLMTEAIIGQTIASLGGAAIRVPALDRELYDVENNTATRIGIAQSGQAFCDGDLGWDAILRYLQDGNNDFSPIDIQEFVDRNNILNLSSRTATDAQAIVDALDEIYNIFSYTSVNRMFFSVLETAALPFQFKYEDLFKTSWIALHGIKILETSGAFDD